MSTYKLIYYLITRKSTNPLINQMIAWLFSYIAVVLCWWTIGIPSEFKQTFIYVFPVYVLQRTVDLKMINKIIKNTLKKRNLIDSSDSESDSSDNQKV